MFYLWFIPAALIVVMVVWLLYVSATKGKNAGVKSEGEVLMDKTSHPRQDVHEE